MNESEREHWAPQLERLARPVLDGVDVDVELSREIVRPYSVAAPLLLHCSNRTAPGSTPEIVRDQPTKNPDLALWWSLVDPEFEPDFMIDLESQGSLFDQSSFTAIEVWTETELAGLHALSHIARKAGSLFVELTKRIGSAVDWHLEYTQPDNATNHPWAVHAFLMHDTREAGHFAETLMSNCLVMNAPHPDPLSAWILHDAADWLRTQP